MASFWSQRTPSERRMLIVCALVIAVAIPLLLMPAGGTSKKLLPARQASLRYQAAVKEKTDYDTRLDQIKPRIEQLVFNDPPEKLLPTVIRQLQDIGRASGIRFREIKPLRAKRFGDVTRVPVSVRFSSEFSKTVPFLYRVEDPAGKLVVDKFNVTASSNKTGQVDVEAHISLFTRAAAATETGA
jgi:Tfp pilus assembly protein PilO